MIKYITKYNNRKFFTVSEITSLDDFVMKFSHKYKGTKQERTFLMKYDYERLEKI